MLLVHHVCRRRARCHANTGASRHEITWTQAVRRRAGRSLYPRRQRESHLTSQRYLPHYSASCGRASAQSPCTETTGSPLRTAPFGKPRGRLPAAKISANLPSGTDAHRRRRAGPPDHVSTLSGPGICPYPASYPGRPAKARLSRPGFPVAFRPPAFASWSSCARQGTGPSLRSAYRSLLPGPDPDGVATFRAHELRPGWVPFLPRGLRCPHGRQVIPGRRMPPRSGPSLHPRPATHHRRLLITRHHQGFTVVHPSGLPLACSSRVEREPSGFFPGLHTPPLPAAHAGVGTGIVGTYLSYVTISWSSTQRSHSPRATSCRTDLRSCR